MSTTPRIFISYSHDSDQHADFVLSLAHQLRQDGLDCQIDQFVNGFPPEGWQRWMESQIEQADFVLLLCTPLYLQRFRGQDKDGGRGVNFESRVISQTLYDAYYHNVRFVPILPNDGSMDNVPVPLKGYGAFRVMADYDGLYRYLTDQAAVVVPELGEVVVKEPKTVSSPKAGLVDKKQRGFAVVSKRTGMSDTLKAAWIGGLLALVAAVIAGIFTLLATPNITITDSECSLVNSGDLSASTTQLCKQDASHDKK